MTPVLFCELLSQFRENCTRRNSLENQLFSCWFLSYGTCSCFWPRWSHSSWWWICICSGIASELRHQSSSCSLGHDHIQYCTSCRHLGKCATNTKCIQILLITPFQNSPVWCTSSAARRKTSCIMIPNFQTDPDTKRRHDSKEAKIRELAMCSPYVDGR